MEFNKSPSPKHQNQHPHPLHHPLNIPPSVNLPSSRTTDTSPNAQTSHKTPKPNLKLNMGKNPSPSGRAMASLANTIPNFSNSGPFSPGIFSARRVWVRRVNGTATTVMVNQSDIIDDLKTNIVKKFPNALGNHFDSAELIIKMDLQARKPPGPGISSTAPAPPPQKKANIWQNSSSPDTVKPLSSPITAAFEKEQSQQTSGPQSAVTGNSYSYINLEPDQNVWNLLELYYPGGMTMSDAFIIETPAFEESYNNNQTRNYYNHSSNNLSNLYRGSTSPINQSQTLPSQSQLHHVQPQVNRSITPNSANSNQGYFHPKPQYLANPQNALYKERSISPNSNQNASPLPNGVSLHRRSQSNPPQSPILNQSASSTNLHQKAASHNQAVLLLPKNFSLSSNSNAHDKKRLSLDENFVSKNRATVTSPLGKNLSNIKSPEEENDEATALKSALPKLNVELSRSLEVPSPPTSQTQTQKQNQSPISPPAQVPQQPQVPVPFPRIDEQLDHQKSSQKNDSSKSVKQESSSKAGSNSNVNGIVKDNNNGNLKNNDTKMTRQSSGSKKTEARNKTTTEAVLPSISVLVVEDNAINQAILGAFLRKHKIHYEIAKNGEEAIAKWRKGGFHLVLMDIQLPVKSGIEATKEIRHLERINRIGVFAENELKGPKSIDELNDSELLDMTIFRSPVIIVALTASSNSSVDRSNALRAGCNDYLTKPVNLVWLQNKITEWGCMQALIDFDGWKTKRSNFNGSSAKILAKSRNRSRSSSQSKALK